MYGTYSVCRPLFPINSCPAIVVFRDFKYKLLGVVFYGVQVVYKPLGDTKHRGGSVWLASECSIFQNLPLAYPVSWLHVYITSG